MPKIELTESEFDIAVELLEREAADLADEIRHTDNHHYRDELKVEEKALLEILHKFHAAKPS